ncbi:ARM repeat-containing protein [Westerdykella ornata]|uniref:ARM repeat-containing protein n=1 Tax=Westerdykella ornata TaxID=318751 RepID=A0A6A6JSS7_WESOR|nr:ARM repeat-containing protein [Westerdykella ornata]KAF2278918.1 ARM repeat-containing protein [Westerdykella ornata]
MQVELSAVELPAEANPLTEGLLFHVLRSASSTDPNQIQTGTKQLQTWEKYKGFYPLLQSVFLDKSLPLEVRYLAIIQLKNGIDKYWRKSATNALDKEDRGAIRSRLLDSGANEADQRLALQNAIVTAKIARHEFPNDWPDLFPSLLNFLRSSTESNAYRLHLPRTLLMLLNIIKELMTGRLTKTKTALRAVTPEAFAVLGRIYVDNVRSWQRFFVEGGDDEGGALDDIEISLMAMKIIRRLVIAGYEFPNRDRDVREFWTVSQSLFREFLPYVLHEDSPLAPGPRKLVEKHLMQHAKFHHSMATSHPVAFVHLPETIPLIKFQYWELVTQLSKTWGAAVFNGAAIGTDGDEEEEAPILERLSLKGLLIIRECIQIALFPIKTLRYAKPEDQDERNNAKQLLKRDLLDQDFVLQVMTTLLQRFFVFRPSDLRMWEEEPDEWEKMEEGSEDWEFAIRPCAEKLFLDLAKSKEYKDLIIGPLLDELREVARPENENIILKDSVYNAAGLAADVLMEKFDVDPFIKDTLVREAQIEKPGYNIIRRRIAIFLSQWISVKVGESTKPIVYQIFQHLLDKSDALNDIVVRVTAGRKFIDVANEWEFKADNFVPYAPLILDRLMALVQEVDLIETKLSLLNTISVIVERLEHNITPYAQHIVSILPPLWEQSGEQHLMKQAILTLLARMVNGMKAASRPFHLSFLPIIQSAIEPDSETQVYLLEDALELWGAIVAQTPSAPEDAPAELLNLIQYLIPLYSMDNETLRKSLDITESYLLLSPAFVLGDAFRPQLLQTMGNLIGELKVEAAGMVCNLVQLVIRAAESLGGEDAVRHIAGELSSSGFLQTVMNGLRKAYQNRNAHGPAREIQERSIDPVLEIDYFAVLARITLASPAILLEILNPGYQQKFELDWLLEEWFAHMENISTAPETKLMALALTRLLETGAPWILGRLQDLMNMWTSVLTYLLDGMDDRTVDCLVWAEEPIVQTNEPEAPEDVRKRGLIYSDPIHRVNLVAFVRERLQQAIQAGGGDAVFQEEWLSRVDKDVLEQFTGLGIFGEGGM